MVTVAKKAVPKELLDSQLADYRKPEDLIIEAEAVSEDDIERSLTNTPVLGQHHDDGDFCISIMGAQE